MTRQVGDPPEHLDDLLTMMPTAALRRQRDHREGLVSTALEENH